jgi:hypothetical protein
VFVFNHLKQLKTWLECKAASTSNQAYSSPVVLRKYLEQGNNLAAKAQYFSADSILTTWDYAGA